MKLHCNVEVSNRVASTSVARRKSQRSILAIGRQSVKTNDLYILWQTTQNKQGTKYKVDGNINQIFTKFINDGKATIRLIEPPHDLIIRADAIQLKSFMHTLKLGITKKLDTCILDISNLNPKSMKSMPKTKIVVTKNSEYPVLEGFPRTAEELFLRGLNKKSFDRQILKLQSLRILNLSENHISSLPRELGSLLHLQELILSQNHLGKASLSKWSWLDQIPIRSSLKLLDISNNLLVELPEQIGKLDALVNLKVSQNMLTYLPQRIGQLASLKYLDISKNSLRSLPGSVKNLCLLSIDISDNAFLEHCRVYMEGDQVPSLVECAAKTLLRVRIPYDASTIPFTLVKLLDEAKYCVCGAASFKCYIRMFIWFNLNLMIQSVKSSGNAMVPFDCYFCSKNCISPYYRVP